jgi:hypothetical protein
MPPPILPPPIEEPIGAVIESSLLIEFIDVTLWLGCTVRISEWIATLWPLFNTA